MKKGKVKCFRGYAKVGSKFNIEVFYTVPDIYYTRLFTCIACGEIFFANQEDIDHADINLASVINYVRCPQCSSPLSQSLKPYPHTFLTEDGEISHYQPYNLIPPDSESFVREFWNLFSEPMQA